MKITYFPWSGMIIFVLSVAGCCLFVQTAKIDSWFLIPAIIISYLLTMRDASAVILDSERLKVISFNFFVGIHSISRKSIIKITSMQTFKDETYGVSGAPYLSLRRWYELIYQNNKGKHITIHFAISDGQKEKLIMENLKLKNHGF